MPQFISTDYASTFPSGARAFRRAFSLMELMVAVSILVVIILAVNVTFSGASKQVGTSQATMELMANVRAVQQMLERDIRQMDRNGYLAIRCRLNDPNQYDASLPGVNPDRSYRFDQMSFLITGEVPNPSGADSTNPFTDSSVANAGHVWFGQLVLEKGNVDGELFMASSPVNPTPQRRLPTGALVDTNGLAVKDASNRPILQENAFALGRNVTALFPGPATGGRIKPAGNSVVAYSTLDGTIAGNTAMIASENVSAHISSGRFGAVAQTPAQVMSEIASIRGGVQDTSLVPEADRYTYRFRALNSIYDVNTIMPNPFVYGYYRTKPIVMRGVSSVRIEWTDGKVYPSGAPGGLAGQLIWYGPTAPIAFGTGPMCSAGYNTPDLSVENFYGAGNANTGDHYIATFSYFNRPKWPKALRITLHVVNDRLGGGRDFTQIVYLPN